MQLFVLIKFDCIYFAKATVLSETSGEVISVFTAAKRPKLNLGVPPITRLWFRVVPFSFKSARSAITV